MRHRLYTATVKEDLCVQIDYGVVRYKSWQLFYYLSALPVFMRSSYKHKAQGRLINRTLQAIGLLEYA